MCGKVVIIGGMEKDLSPIREFIKENYRGVLGRIASAARSVDREPDSVQLVVVTKGHPVERVQAVVEAGAPLLGENYVEEAQPKIDALSYQANIEWHMIGHIQSRKAKPVVENFDWVHSLDRMKIAMRLNLFSGELNRKLPVLLELNVSGEESKYGWPAWDDDKVRELLGAVREILEFPYLQVRGLMTMAPYLAEPEAARPYFKRLRQIQQILTEAYPHADWRELSMGMSADFEIAIQEGATIVRIGTAILGDRP